MFRIVSLTDIHLADKNPISRIDNYCESILNKLEQAKDLCVDRKVDLVLCGGDIFHIKAPTRNSHYLVSQVIDIFKSFPCLIYIVLGNHDISQDNINSLPRQPVNTLLKSGACHLLNDRSFDNKKIRIFGIDYLTNPDYKNFSKKKSKEEKVQICVAHVNASSKFDDLFGERVYTYQELENTSPDIFIFGHYHPDQGIEVRNNKYFVNVGSISRGSLKKDELDRVPNLGYIEIDDSYNITCEKYPLNVAKSEEIFDLELKEKEEKEQEEIEKFVNEMKDKIITLSDDDDIKNTIKSLSFEKRIIDKAMSYYEKAT